MSLSHRFRLYSLSEESLLVKILLGVKATWWSETEHGVSSATRRYNVFAQCDSLQTKNRQLLIVQIICFTVKGLVSCLFNVQVV